MKTDRRQETFQFSREKKNGKTLAASRAALHDELDLLVQAASRQHLPVPLGSCHRCPRPAQQERAGESVPRARSRGGSDPRCLGPEGR